MASLSLTANLEPNRYWYPTSPARIGGCSGDGDAPGTVFISSLKSGEVIVKKVTALIELVDK